MIHKKHAYTTVRVCVCYKILNQSRPLKISKSRISAVVLLALCRGFLNS